MFENDTPNSFDHEDENLLNTSENDASDIVFNEQPEDSVIDFDFIPDDIFNAEPDYISHEYNPVHKKSKPHSNIALVAFLVVVCMICSSVFGFMGAFIANKLPDNKIIDSSSVIYQSVIQTTKTSSNAGKLSVEDVVANVKDSVVEIVTETISKNGRMGQLVSTGAGSGVIISGNGYIVTNNHVISEAQTITVRMTNGREYDAKLIGTDAKNDLAVIKIEETNLKSAVYGYSSDLNIGETSIAIGNPLGELGGTVTEGIISALDREISFDGESMSLLQTSAAINPGNSGGGLFDLYGTLIGVVNAKSSGTGIEGLGFAIPIDTAKKSIEEIINYGYVRGRIDTGLELIDIQDSQTAFSYRVSIYGLYISWAKSSDFKSGDIITAVDGKKITDITDFNTALHDYEVGDTISITVNRNNSNATIELVLEELKS